MVDTTGWTNGPWGEGWPGCCCDGTPPNDWTTTCYPFIDDVNAPGVIASVTISGIADGAIAPCSNLNGVYEDIGGRIADGVGNIITCCSYTYSADFSLPPYYTIRVTVIFMVNRSTQKRGISVSVERVSEPLDPGYSVRFASTDTDCFATLCPSAGASADGPWPTSGSITLPYCLCGVAPRDCDCSSNPTAEVAW